ncbi:tetratricopeptide repeat protein [candidate division KSB1 bacterium]|nr:tetratricopeptide repeat protein [candidate division KSB1 bacterium]
MYRKTIEIRENVYGTNHPETAKALYNLALLRKNLRDYKSAESLYRQALDSATKTLGSNHSLTDVILDNLVGLYNTKLQAEKGKRLLQQYGKKVINR